MLDPKKLLDRLPRPEKTKPLRYLGRRVIQAIAEHGAANLVLGTRTAPGRYLVLRLVETVDEKDRWEQQFAESREAVLREVQRETAAREITLRSAPAIDLFTLTEEELRGEEGERLLGALLESEAARAVRERLPEEREVILPRKTLTLLLESEPSEAQAYVDDRPVGVTPCRVEDLPAGDHLLTFSRPGYLPLEERFRLEPDARGGRRVRRVVLTPEPPMGVLEVRTFPPGARVEARSRAVEGPAGTPEARDTPARWRLPAGDVELRVTLEDFEPQALTVRLPHTPDDRPHVVQLPLNYIGPYRDEVVGRLIIYRPTPAAPGVPSAQEPLNRIGAFFQETDPDRTLSDWSATPDSEPEEPEVLAEVPLKRGVKLLGREDPHSNLKPDIRLFDAENSVSRGCHAWLWVYADVSTGAAFNTFLIGNNSPAGIRVDGALVMETRRLADDAVVELGNFRLRVQKEIPEPRVEIEP